MTGLLMRPLLFVVYWLTTLTPRDNERWVFGSWSGERYADNSAALFEYINSEKYHHIRAIWLTYRPEIVRQIRERNQLAYLIYSPMGLLEALRAGVSVVDGSSKDVGHWLTGGSKLVLLRHGTGIKQTGRLIENKKHRLYRLYRGKTWERMFWGILIPWHLKVPDLVIAASDQQMIEAQYAFNAPLSSIVKTGLPRFDRYYKNNTPDIKCPRLRSVLENAKECSENIILITPTYRDFSTCPYKSKWGQINEIFIELDAACIVHQHTADRDPSRKREIENLSNIFYADRELDISTLFFHVNGLVSDYSSISYEFMHTGKPIILYVPDIEAYFTSSRTLLYDFDTVAAGPQIKTLKRLELELHRALNDQLQKWPGRKYIKLRRQFHEFEDGDSCDRVYKKIVDRFCS